MTSESLPPTLVPANPAAEAKPPLERGPGRAIRLARERARLTLEELATLTKLARSTLEALERDDFETLNEAVYVRGYYRKCAKVLALPEAELLANYERMVVPKAPQAPTKLLLGSGQGMGRARIRRRGNTGRTIAIVVAAAVIGAIIWFLFNDPGLVGALKKPVSTHSSDSATPVSSTGATTGSSGGTSTVSETPTPAPAAPASTSTAALPAPSNPPQTLSTTVALSASSAAAAATTTTAAASDSSQNTVTSTTLSMQFKSTSWIRVEDADGKVLLSGVIQAGDRQHASGKPPYAVFIGNAPGVAVEYGGKPVNISAFIKQNSTARFAVP